MKNLVFLFSFLVLAFSASAQIQLKATRATSGAVSGSTELTVTDAGTDTLFTPSTSKGKLAIFVVTFTRTSGTAGGTATLQGSIDGTDWVTVGSAYTVTNVAAATTSFKVLAVDNAFTSWRIIYAGTGTMVNKFRAKVSLF